MTLLPALIWVLSAANLYGDVRAEGTREPVAAASVEVVELGRAARVDEHGYFVIAGVRSGEWTIRDAILHETPPASVTPILPRLQEGGRAKVTS